MLSLEGKKVSTGQRRNFYEVSHGHFFYHLQDRYLLGERVPPPCKPCSGRLLTVEAGEPQHLGEGGGEIEQMWDEDIVV